MIGVRLNATPITLYTDVDTLDGSDAVSIAAWAAATYYPADTWLKFTNTGAAALTIGDNTTPAMLTVDGIPACILFEGRVVTIDPDDSFWARVPATVAALGDDWAVDAVLDSGATASVTVEAFRVETSAPTAAEVVTAVVASALGTNVAQIKGLSNGNVAHDQAVWAEYSGQPRMTSCRIRVFPTSGDTIAKTNAIATYNMTATYDTDGTLLTYEVSGT